MKAIRRRERIEPGGRLVVHDLAVAAGTAVEVIVLVGEPTEAGVEPLLAAAESSLAFWDNPIDDETWNDA